MIVKLLTEHHLEFLCLKEGCRGSPESTYCQNVKLLEISCCSSYCIVAKEEAPKEEANGPKLTVISRGKPMSPQTTQQRDSPKTVPARSLVPKEEPSTDF